VSYTFRPAVRTKTSVLTAIAGTTGTGKTFSALKLATGLAGPTGKIAFIDTEAGRALHYADQFRFDHLDLKAPFRPAAYRDAIVAAEEAGYDVIVIDSMSHEYEGEGGILEWADALLDGGEKSPGNWKEPKSQHKRMMNRLVQCRAHLIFCLRAEEKMLVEQVAQLNNDGSPKMWNGKPSMKTVVTAAKDRPVQERWHPICEKRFMYEMTASFLLLPDKPGVGIPVKLQEQHRPFFPEGQRISEDSGAGLGAWARGAAAGNATKMQPLAALPSEPPAQSRQTAECWLDDYRGKLADAATPDQLADVQQQSAKALAKLSAQRPDLHGMAMEAGLARFREIAGPDDDGVSDGDDFPGDRPFDDRVSA